MKVYTTGVKLNSDDCTITFELDKHDFEAMVSRGVYAYTRLAIGDGDETELTANLKKLISEHEDKLHYGYATDDMAANIRALFRMYEQNAATAISDAQRFQNDMTLWLQALALVAQMVSNAATHSEKDARMRGFVEMLESALSKVKEYDYRLDHFNRRGYRYSDLFVSDYPVRHYKERAEQAEQELEQLKKRLIEKPQGEPESTN